MQEIFDDLSQEKTLELGLYIVATPIGNMADITIRALSILKNVDIIFCEDTRITKKLLSFFNIKNKIVYTYNDHSDENQRNNIINLIKNDKKNIALVSDAGTPLISDPGYKLVAECKNQNIKVIPIVGASALLASLCSAGISSDKFLFYGFLSQNKKEKEEELKEILEYKNTTICYETPNRLTNTLKIINLIDSERKICIAREITKIFEDIKTDSVNNLLKYYEENIDKLKGELVIIIEKKINIKNLDLIINNNILKSYLKYLSKKDCAGLLSELYKLNKKDIYKILINIEE